MNSQEQTIQPVTTPRPYGEIPRLWLWLPVMTESFFSQEVSRASAANTFFGILIYAVLAAFLSVVQSVLGGVINYFGGSAAAHTTALLSAVGVTTVFLCCFILFLGPASFYLNSGIMYVSALIFGGRGKFTSQAYLTSLFFVPLALISSVLGMVSVIPQVGLYGLSAVLLAIGFFHIVFMTRVLKVVHGFSTGRAVAAVLAPLVLLLIPICLIALLALMGPAIGNVFSTINASLGTPAP